MSVYPYLVAIAFIKENNKRAMPLGGKALKEEISSDSLKDTQAESIALELLLRIFLRSKGNPIDIAGDDKSLILVQIPLITMQNHVPILKSEWLSNGNNEQFIEKLNRISLGIWNLKFVRYEGILFEKFNL